MHRLIALLGLLSLTACASGVPRDARIVVSGDSVMSWNRTVGASVSDQLSAMLAEPVGDTSFPWVRVDGNSPIPGMTIKRQVQALSPEWAILSGGANDLNLDCGCMNCEDALDRLLTRDGQSGSIAEMVQGLRSRGSKVLWADYYTAPKYAGTICERPYDELNARLRRMAAADPGVLLIDMVEVMPSSDPTLFAGDRLHPSPQGSTRIAGLIAQTLRRADPTIGP